MTDRFIEEFPRHSHRFFRELAKDNDIAWYGENRQRYHEQVLDPAREFVRTIGARLQRWLPGIQADPRANGRGSISRIQRDTRFARDKTPYRTFLGLLFWQGDSGTRWEVPSFHLVLTPGQATWTAGQRRFTSLQLDAWREHCTDPGLHRLLRRLETAGYELLGQHYKRLPRGLDPAGDPVDTLRRHRGLFASRRQAIKASLVGDDFRRLCLEQWKPLVPLNRWLNEALEIDTK